MRCLSAWLATVPLRITLPFIVRTWTFASVWDGMPAAVSAFVTLWLMARSAGASGRVLAALPDSDPVALCPLAAVPAALFKFGLVPEAWAD